MKKTEIGDGTGETGIATRRRLGSQNRVSPLDGIVFLCYRLIVAAELGLDGRNETRKPSSRFALFRF